MESHVTYAPAEIGTSRVGEPMPAGYRHLSYETFIGYGAATMRTSANAVLSLEMHRTVGLRADLEGDIVRLRIGPIHAPCRILFRESAPERAGFTYGTLPGHPARGEETFLVTHGPDDRVWLQVRSFSVAGRWYTRLAGPAMPMLQRRFARACGRALRRLASASALSSRDADHRS
ncbi:MAG TPA: DUF1990 domain-containing protein [Candidatus Limnocylindrales bacterium]